MSLLPLSLIKTLGIGQYKPKYIPLLLADHCKMLTFGVGENVLIKIDKFYLSTNFCIIGDNGRSNFPDILGFPLLAMRWALMDVINGTLTFHAGGEIQKFEVS